MNKTVNLHLLKSTSLQQLNHLFYICFLIYNLFSLHNMFPYVVCLPARETKTNDTKEPHYNDYIIYSLLFLQIRMSALLYNFSTFFLQMNKLNRFRD